MTKKFNEIPDSEVTNDEAESIHLVSRSMAYVTLTKDIKEALERSGLGLSDQWNCLMLAVAIVEQNAKESNIELKPYGKDNE